MKKFSSIFAFAVLFSIRILAQDAAPAPDFSGEWLLDKSKSSLPEMIRGVESLSMSVRQNETELTVTTSYKKGESPGKIDGPGIKEAPPSKDSMPPKANPKDPSKELSKEKPKDDLSPTPMPTIKPGGGDQWPAKKGIGGGGSTTTYSLTEAETATTMDTPNGQVPVKLSAKIEDGKLKLTKSLKLKSTAGEVAVTKKETWSLAPDGKTLTVKSESDSPDGGGPAEMVFTKKP